MPAEFPGILKFTGWREPISISGAGKVVDGILRRRPCFLCPVNCSPRKCRRGRAGSKKYSVLSGLRRSSNRKHEEPRGSERPGAIALATRPGNYPFDFPEYPDEARTQTDDDAEEQQGQSRGREHVQHLC